MAKKTLEVPVVVGTGTGQFFIETDIVFSPPVFMVKEIKKWVDIYDQQVIPGKIIFNGWVWKDINYKTVKHVCDQGTVSGPVYHNTSKTVVAGVVEITPNPGEEVLAGDRCEVLEAVVEGEKDEWSGEIYIQGQKVNTKVHEKMVVRVTFKVVRDELVPVEVDP